MFVTFGRSLICALALGVASYGSMAKAAFDAPSAVSDDATGQQEVAMNAAGEAVIVWRHFNSVAGNYEIQGRRRSPAGVYGPIQTLSAASPDTFTPKVALDKAGNAFVVWRAGQTAPNQNRAYGRPWPGGGAPGPIAPLSAPQVGYPTPDVAVGDNGPAVVVWAQFLPAPENYQTIQTRTIALNGALGPVTNLSNVNGCGAIRSAEDPHVGVSANGAAVAVWTISCIGNNKIIQARARFAGGAWGGLQWLTPPVAGEADQSPQVAVNARGDAIVVWQHYGGVGARALPANAATVGGRFAAAGGAFGAIQTFSAAPVPDIRSRFPRAGLNSAGNALIVWGQENFAASLEQVQARVRNAGGALGAVQNLSALGGHGGEFYGLAPRVAVNPAGYAMVAWQIANPVCRCVDSQARALLTTGARSTTLP